jgi:sec-independent protein translocase protein TatC
MPKRNDQDLFAESTMSFGEHLEELRLALSKALIGLLIGFLLGLGVANYVVSYIQTPLKKALEDHYIAKAVARLQSEYGGFGEVSPDVEAFIRSKRFVYDKIYLEANEVLRVSSLATQYEAAQPPPDAAGRAADQTPSDQAPSDRAPSAGSQTDGDALPAAREAVILGAEIPPPEATFVVARVWRPIDTVVKALNAQEAFMIWLKAAFVSGLVISSPYMFWQLWAFVAAGLYRHERKYVYIYLPFSTVLFLAGVAVAFYLVFQYVLNFLFTFNAAMNIDPDPRISEWLSFVLILPLGFGIAFQLPLVMLFLHRIGMFSIKAYLDKWRIAVLVIFVISMLLTPADPISMLLMALPLCLLYFLGIAMCKWMPRNQSPVGEGYDP